jgi:hypothetical protein
MAAEHGEQGNLAIFKIVAAQRQLDAAIRMFFAEEDELAIHTVGAAVYTVLRDLLDSNPKEGRWLVSLVRRGIVSTAKRMGINTLNEHDKTSLQDPQIRKIVEAVVAANKYHDAFMDRFLFGGMTAEDERSIASNDGRLPDPVADILSVIDGRSLKGFVDRMNFPANFLKHADNDKRKLLNLSDVDNQNLLAHACSAYWEKTSNMTLEMELFLGFCAAEGLIEYDSLLMPVEDLQGLDLSGRCERCFDLIKKARIHRPKFAAIHVL